MLHYLNWFSLCESILVDRYLRLFCSKSREVIISPLKTWATIRYLAKPNFTIYIRFHAVLLRFGQVDIVELLNGGWHLSMWSTLLCMYSTGACESFSLKTSLWKWSHEVKSSVAIPLRYETRHFTVVLKSVLWGLSECGGALAGWEGEWVLRDTRYEASVAGHSLLTLGAEGRDL